MANPAAVPPVAAAAAVGTMVHLGSANCPLTPLGTPPTVCASPNNATVTFATGFNPAVNKISLDLGSLWGGLDLNTSKTWMSAGAAFPAPVAPAVDLPRYYFGKFNINPGAVLGDPATGLPLATPPVAPALFVIQ